MSRPRALVWGAVIVLSVSARFVFETSLVDRLPASVAVSAAIVPAALALALLAVRLPERCRLDRTDMLLAGSAGVLGVWLAPFLVAVVRASDTPSGSEVLFITSALSGLTLVVAFAAAARRFDAVRLSAALLAVVGAAGILANWERPSSFSPFVKFPEREAVMLLAGVAFAVAMLLLLRVVRRRGALAAARAAALSGAAASVLAALLLDTPSLWRLGDPDVWPFVLPAAAATFGLLLGWSQGLGAASPASLAAAYLLAPVAVTGLSFVERHLGALGPDPIRWGAAGPAIVLSVAAAALVALPGPEEGPAGARASRLLAAARVVALASLAAAIVGLVMPDILVSVQGVRTSGPVFRTEFAMTGVETAGGWLAVCCTLLTAAWSWRPEAQVRQTVLRACVVFVAIAVWLPLHATPLHTWNRWIPPEVQQDYGTEYASRTERPVANPWEMASLGGAAAAAALVLSGRRSGSAASGRGQEVASA